MNGEPGGADTTSPRRGTPVAVGVGSNLGRRAAELERARDRLGELLVDLRCSRVYETEPADGRDEPAYLNMCCVGRTGLGPRTLLRGLLEIERRSGREPPPRAGPRPLDLDLLLFGERRVAGPGVTVPHPRMSERPFVLLPLAEVAPEWSVPGTEGTVGDLARETEPWGVLRVGPLEAFLEVEEGG